MKIPHLPRIPAAAFSLIEVVVALGIFAFSILTIIGLMGSSLKLTRDNEERIQAANVATILMARYQEMLASSKRGESPNWGSSFPLQQAPGASPVGNLQNGSSDLIDNLGNEVPREEDAAFGLRHLVSKEPIAGSAMELVRCTLQFQWPVGAASNQQPVNTYTATTAFVLSP